MKKLLFMWLLAIFFISNAVSTSTAFALSHPYAVIGNDVWMLERDTGRKLFVLPETYYAKINEMDNDYYYIVFNSIEGKILKNSVSVVGYDKETIGTSKTLGINNQFSVFTEIKIRVSLESAGEESFTIPTNETFTYLGTYKQGEKEWYYVTFGGQYGYVESNYTDEPNLSFENFIPEVSQEVIDPIEQSPPEEDEEDDLVKILVLSGVSVVAIVLAIIIFIPKKGKKHKYYYS